MSDSDSFWDIVSKSGIDPTTVPDSEIALSDLASVLQSVSEASSWISHYMMNAIGDDPPKVPISLYAILAVLQTSAREIISNLSPCTCAVCRPER